MAIKPITGMLRRQLIFDLAVGIGSGLVMANVFWYGFHMPRVEARNKCYVSIEAKRAADLAEVRKAVAEKDAS